MESQQPHPQDFQMPGQMPCTLKFQIWHKTLGEKPKLQSCKRNRKILFTAKAVPLTGTTLEAEHYNSGSNICLKDHIILLVKVETISYEEWHNGEFWGLVFVSSLKTRTFPAAVLSWLEEPCAVEHFLAPAITVRT